MLAISTSWSFPRRGNLADAVDDVAAIKFDAVELRANGAAPDHLDGARHAAEIRMKCPSVAAPLDPRPWAAGDPLLGLSSPDETRRRAAVNAALTTLPAASAAGARVILIRLGEVEVPGLTADDPPDLDRRREHRDRHLDAAARSLFELLRAESGVVWSIETPRTWLSLPDLEEVELLVSDAGRRSVAYTHDVAAAHRLGGLGVADPEAWLEAHGAVTSGVLLSDRAGEFEGLPPGAGEVDFAGLAAQVGSGMLRTLLLDPRHPAADVVAGAERLKGLGLD
jgi:sugar phosphate isomerase/epimerase